MGHRITIEGLRLFSGILTEQMIHDAIDMFYRWEDTNFQVVCHPDHNALRKACNDPKLSKTVRGQHRYSAIKNLHIIDLVHAGIVDAFEKQRAAGGNIPPPTLSAAALMTLTHEIQHGNQIKSHTRNSTASFWNEPSYMDRACERDARGFVDEKIDEICAYLQIPLRREHRVATPGDPYQEVREVAEVLGECSEVTPDDVREELRYSKILNPKNYGLVVELLRKEGIQVRK